MENNEIDKNDENLEEVVQSSSVTSAKGARLKNIIFDFLNFLKTIALIIILAFIIRFFVIQPFIVEGQSMEPTFDDRDYLITEKINYYFRTPERGEVVIFHPPGDSSTNYIKRVIGLPGDNIQIKSGAVYVNGERLAEPYLLDNKKTNAPDQKEINITLNNDEFYVLGDNRDHSRDSRELGAIGKNNIVSRVWFRLYPFNQIKTFAKVNYVTSF